MSIGYNYHAHNYHSLTNMFLVTMEGVVTGIFLPFMFSLFGARVGRDGVDYYGEIHTTSLNSYCHSLGMPFVVYGIFTGLPMFFNSNYDYHHYINIQRFLHVAYTTHYLTIDWKIGALTGMVYAIPTYYANKKIEDTFSNVGHPNNANARDVFFYFRINTAVYGFMIAVISLIIQEVFGHWLSGDPQSRLEAIPNAIMYAAYFSISHMFGQ